MAEEEEATGSVLSPLGDLGDVEGGIVLSINEDKSLVAQGVISLFLGRIVSSTFRRSVERRPFVDSTYVPYSDSPPFSNNVSNGAVKTFFNFVVLK